MVVGGTPLIHYLDRGPQARFGVEHAAACLRGIVRSKDSNHAVADWIARSP